MTAIVANNGQEALNILDRKEKFDGVLMDCQMPIMDGFTATCKIREQNRFKDLPIIAMTANAMKEDVEKCIDAGMNDHIAKPIIPDIMFSTMAKWILSSCQKVDIKSAEEVTTSSEKDFSNLPGINFSKSTLKKAAMFKKYLLKFPERFGNFAEEFKEAQNSNDKTAPMRAAHELKGLSSTLGMEDLQEQARLLEKANMEQSDDIEDLFKSTLVDLDIVLKSIDSYIASLDD